MKKGLENQMKWSKFIFAIFVMIYLSGCGGSSSGDVNGDMVSPPGQEPTTMPETETPNTSNPALPPVTVPQPSISVLSFGAWANRYDGTLHDFSWDEKREFFIVEATVEKTPFENILKDRRYTYEGDVIGQTTSAAYSEEESTGVRFHGKAVMMFKELNSSSINIKFQNMTPYGDTKGIGLGKFPTDINFSSLRIGSSGEYESAFFTYRYIQVTGTSEHFFANMQGSFRGATGETIIGKFLTTYASGAFAVERN